MGSVRIASAHELLAPRPRLLDDVAERLALLEVGLEDDAGAIARDVRRGVEHEAPEVGTRRGKLEDLARPTDVHVLGGLPIDAEVADVRGVMDPVDLLRERPELRAGQPEVHRRGVAFDEVHAVALIERQLVEDGARLGGELGPHHGVDERA